MSKYTKAIVAWLAGMSTWAATIVHSAPTHITAQEWLQFIGVQVAALMVWLVRNDQTPTPSEAFTAASDALRRNAATMAPGGIIPSPRGVILGEGEELRTAPAINDPCWNEYATENVTRVAGGKTGRVNVNVHADTSEFDAAMASAKEQLDVLKRAAVPQAGATIVDGQVYPLGDKFRDDTPPHSTDTPEPVNGASE